jgi:uncharacterized protein YlxW (UPF0749 family)
LQKKQSLSMNSDASDIENTMDSVQTQLRECEKEINGFEEELSKYIISDNDEISVLRFKLNEKVASENAARGHGQACQRKYDVTMMELNSAEMELPSSSRRCTLLWN